MRIWNPIEFLVEFVKAMSIWSGVQVLISVQEVLEWVFRSAWDAHLQHDLMEVNVELSSCSEMEKFRKVQFGKQQWQQHIMNWAAVIVLTYATLHQRCSHNGANSCNTSWVGQPQWCKLSWENICSFLPQHSINLANQFRWLCFGTDLINDIFFWERCFVNFDLDGLIHKDKNTSEAPLWQK